MNSRRTTDLPAITLAISACLNGQEVRYDGASRRFKLRKSLAEFVQFKPFCPEIAIGLGVPRKTLRLVGDVDEPRVIQTDGQLDFTEQLQRYADQIATELEADHSVCGYILCKGSPSCGMQAVKRYNTKGDLLGQDASGAFAAQLRKRMPYLPLEEDGRLNDRGLLENFLTRVHALARWRTALANGVSSAKLIQFHSQHKFLLLAHSQESYRRLGRLLANLTAGKPDAVAGDYITEFMLALAKVPSHGNHANALMHLQGFVKESISSKERAELSESILAYRNREVPRQVPLALLRHHLMNNPNEYAQAQWYFEPFPARMSLQIHS